MCIQTHGNINVCVQTHGNINECAQTLAEYTNTC